MDAAVLDRSRRNLKSSISSAALKSSTSAVAAAVSGFAPIAVRPLAPLAAPAPPPAEPRPEPPVKPKRTITMRQATSRDLTALYDCLLGYFDECKLFYPPPTEAHVITWGLGIVNNGHVQIAECDGKIIGSVGLELGTFPWNHQAHYINAVWFYVRPDYRKTGGTAVHLINFAKSYADKANLPLRMDEIWGFEPEKVAAFKKRKGFRHIGGNFGYFPSDPINPTG